jgi:hypothetical protein
MSAVAHAVPSMIVGNWNLLPNTPGQVVQVLVDSSEEQVAGLDLYLFVNNNVGPAPIITAVDIIGPGTIFNPNNVGQTTLGPPYDVPGLQTSSITTTSAGFVTADGILAFVTVDTTGIFAGTFPVSLTNPDLGPSDFAVDPGNDAILVNGQWNVIPEPSSIVMGLFAAAGLGAVMIRRRFARG